MANINIPVYTTRFPRPYYLLIQDPEEWKEDSSRRDSANILIPTKSDFDEDVHLQPPPQVQQTINKPQLVMIPSDGLRLLHVDDHGPPRAHDFIAAVYLALEYLGREDLHPTHAIQDQLRDEDALYRCTSSGYRDTMMNKIVGSICNGFQIQRVLIGRHYLNSLHLVPSPQEYHQPMEEDIF